MTTATLTAALAAVETAWDDWSQYDAGMDAVRARALGYRMGDLLAALRAVRSSGGTVCVLSRESVAALRVVHASMSTRDAEGLCELLFDEPDLASEQAERERLERCPVCEGSKVQGTEWVTKGNARQIVDVPCVVCHGTGRRTP